MYEYYCLQQAVRLLLKCPILLSTLWHVKSLHKLPFLMVKLNFLLHLWQLEFSFSITHSTSTYPSLSTSLAFFRSWALYPSTLLWKYLLYMFTSISSSKSGFKKKLTFLTSTHLVLEVYSHSRLAYFDCHSWMVMLPFTDAPCDEWRVAQYEYIKMSSTFSSDSSKRSLSSRICFNCVFPPSISTIYISN